MKAIIPMIAAGVVLIAAGTALAQDDTCASRVAHELSQHGLSMNNMKDVQWQTERTAAGKDQGDGTVSGYNFYARPSSCSSGQIVIEMWQNCGVQDIYTHGGCKITGVSSSWF